MCVWSQVLFFSPSDPTHWFKGPKTLFNILTAALQIYCNIHIVYCKWQQYKEDKSAEERSIQAPAINQHFHLNTIAYNKILADLKHIFSFLVYLALTFTLRRLRYHFMIDFDKLTIKNQSKIFLYLLDFGPKMLLFFVFPLIFYCTHKELRTYWKNSFTICRKNQG